MRRNCVYKSWPPVSMLLRHNQLYFYGCNVLKCLKSTWQPCPWQQARRLCSSVKEKDGGEVGQSWVQLLYNNEDINHDENLPKLRRKLEVAVTSTRSHEKGDLLPYRFVEQLVKFYKSQVHLDEKAVLFQHLADKLGIDFDAVLTNIRKSEGLLQNERLRYRYQQTLVNNLTPSYKYLFDDISKLQFGTSFLVHMREDLLTCFRRKHLLKTPALLSFDSCLKEHLAKWFANGFLDLEEVSWDKSSGQLLEKVMEYEAVHVMKDWNDLKLRASRGRRIFIFTHKLMPDEPLVILHTLLGNEIPNNIQTVINTPIKDENVTDITTATFYSVTSTQRGLDGIGLGNLLIKRVVEKLKNDFYGLSTFVTLSPIPGFRKWLDLKLLSVEASEASEEIPPQLSGIFFDGRDGLLKLKQQLSTPGWHHDHELCEFLREPMTRLCVEYLCNSKRRGFASNPVAHFHLRNGACLWRINWLGNSNGYGLKSSYGFMANYRYELSELEKNNNDYVQLGNIAVSSDVRRYLRN